MAGIPCINDTCSITSTVDANRRLSLNARLDPDGGIVCTEGEGLGVQIIGNTGVAAGSLDACDTLLGMTTTGQLFARRPEYEYVSQGSPNQDLASSSSATGTPLVVTNNAACRRLMIWRVAWQFTATVTDIAANSGFGTNGVFHLDIDTLGAGFTQEPWNLMGGLKVGDGTQVLTTGHNAVSFDFIEQSQVVTFTPRATRSGSWGTVAGTGGSNGFTATVRVVVIDLEPGNTIL